jgi:hypothetical protein
MSYSFPKGRECIIISPTDNGTTYNLQKPVSFEVDDKYDTMVERNTLPGNIVAADLDKKAKFWKNQGYTMFHFFGKKSREFYLIGFIVGEGDSEFD